MPRVKWITIQNNNLVYPWVVHYTMHNLEYTGEITKYNFQIYIMLPFNICHETWAHHNDKCTTLRKLELLYKKKPYYTVLVGGKRKMYGIMGCKYTVSRYISGPKKFKNLGILGKSFIHLHFKPEVLGNQGCTVTSEKQKTDNTKIWKFYQPPGSWWTLIIVPTIEYTPQSPHIKYHVLWYIMYDVKVQTVMFKWKRRLDNIEGKLKLNFAQNSTIDNYKLCRDNKM